MRLRKQPRGPAHPVKVASRVFAAPGARSRDNNGLQAVARDKQHIENTRRQARRTAARWVTRKVALHRAE